MDPVTLGVVALMGAVATIGGAAEALSCPPVRSSFTLGDNSIQTGHSSI